MAGEQRRIKIDAEIPQGEYEILIHYARGASIRQLVSEKNTHKDAIISILRRNLSKFLGLSDTDTFINKRPTSKRRP